MSRTRGQDKRPQPRPPVDRHNGIPDCRARRPAWVLGLLAAVFLAWLVVLAWIKVAA
jgi:hypothetical protein